MITILLKKILCKTHNYYWHEIYTKYATYKLQQLRLEQFSKVQLESKTLFIKKILTIMIHFLAMELLGY